MKLSRLTFVLIILVLFSLTGCEKDKTTGAVVYHETNVGGGSWRPSNDESLESKVESLEQEVLFLVGEINRIKNIDSTLEQCEVDLSKCDRDLTDIHGLERKEYKGLLKIYRPSSDEYPGAQFCCNIKEGRKGETCFKLFLKPDCIKIKIHGDDIDRENWME